jgi:allantoin racemase
MRLLVINSNTSTVVTERVATAARSVASPGTELVFATGRFGAEVIASRAEEAIAGHSTLDLVVNHAQDCDGVMIAVSYDSGLRAARELVGRPVVAITEASLLTALMLGTRIGLVIWGRGALSLYMEIIQSYGVASRICGVRQVDHPLRTNGLGEESLDEALIAAATDLVEKDGAEVIVLVGAILSGRSRHLEARCAVPMLDGMRCGLPLLEAMVRIAPHPARTGSYAFPGGRASSGLSAALGEQLALERPLAEFGGLNGGARSKNASV